MRRNRSRGGHAAGSYIVFVAASIVTGHYWVEDGISGEVKRPCWSRNV